MAATTDPKTHKALGRKVKKFDGKYWDQHKLRIVEEGSYHKFTKSEDAANLKKLILETGDREIVEVSHVLAAWKRLTESRPLHSTRSGASDLARRTPRRIARNGAKICSVLRL